MQLSFAFVFHPPSLVHRVRSTPTLTLKWVNFKIAFYYKFYIIYSSNILLYVIFLFSDVNH